jgi:hypothetical protein
MSLFRIKAFYYDVRRGFSNIRLFFKIIWKWHPYDWSKSLELLIFSLEAQRDCMLRSKSYDRSEEIADMNTVIDLFKENIALEEMGMVDLVSYVNKKKKELGMVDLVSHVNKKNKELEEGSENQNLSEDAETPRSEIQPNEYITYYHKKQMLAAINYRKAFKIITESYEDWWI